MEHPARRALLIAPALMFDSVIPNIYGNSVIILTCLDTVGKKPCEKRRKTRSFQCEKERKPGTFFNRTLRSRYTPNSNIRGFQIFVNFPSISGDFSRKKKSPPIFGHLKLSKIWKRLAVTGYRKIK
jgi:hypothetical protein